ncbi:MAG: choice-of-anchor Q domain-containing protein [Candidatus Marinimicrobia bacterium]|nr:choice-of-anchor Q domain-containing protein [Candidatus Neomarinimicrobiota bacterium]
MNRNILSLCVILVMSMTMSTNLIAATRTVGASGYDYTTVTAAISAASNGDIIDVYGTLTESNISVGKDLTIQGQGTETTIIQAHASAKTADYRVFTVFSGRTVTIKEMTIQNGYATIAEEGDIVEGGGINNSGTLTITNCVVSDNANDGSDDGTDADGGGIYNSGTLTIENCTVNGNHAGDGRNGGGIYNSGTLSLTNCTVNGNDFGAESDGNGGGIYNTSTLTTTNCTISGNSAADGGGIYNTSSLTITNCTLSQNIAGIDAGSGNGGGIYNSAGTVYIKNTLLADNSINEESADDFKNITGATVTDNGYNIVEVSAGYTFSATGDLTGEQASLNLNSTLADNTTLFGTKTLKTTSSSVAINAGSSSGANNGVDPPAHDQRGASRNGSTDIGAYEYHADDGSFPVKVTSLADDGGNDLVTLREAINGISAGGEFTFTVTGTITLTSELAINKNMTITGPGVDQLSVDGNDACRVFLIGTSTTNPSVTISDLTITNGNTATAANNDGAGVYNYSDSLTLENCTISESSADYGAGMYNNAEENAASPVLTNCTISGNTAAEDGGGMYNYSSSSSAASSPSLTNCTISDNSADSFGGGMFNCGSDATSSPNLTRCTITGNSAASGGGMYNDGSSEGVSSPSLTNCIISGNSASDDGGGMYNWAEEEEPEGDPEPGGHASPSLSSCTISGNKAGANGGGMYNYQSYSGTSSPDLTNCILWGNAATTAGNEVYNDSATPTYTYCDIEGSGGSGSWESAFGTNSGNNIDSDPKFETEPNPALAPQVVDDSDLLLTNGSPCLGTGSVPGSAPSNDRDTRSRPLPASASYVDMGAYEQYDTDASLPVTLCCFTCVVKNESIVLEWQTSVEIENQGFIISRRTSTTSWLEIASFTDNEKLEGHRSTTTSHDYRYCDSDVKEGVHYAYMLSDIDYRGTRLDHDNLIQEITFVNSEKLVRPNAFKLISIYPNPFNPSTTVSYELHEATKVHLSIYGITGKLVKTLAVGKQPAGYYDVRWNGLDDSGNHVGTGVYFARLQAGDFGQTIKMLYLK